MRVSMKFLLAAALVVPAGMVVTSATGAGAAGGTSCAHTAGTATFTPPLPVSGSASTVTSRGGWTDSNLGWRGLMKNRSNTIRISPRAVIIA